MQTELVLNKTKTNVHYLHSGIIVFLIMLYTLLATVVNGISFSDGLLFFLYQIFAIYVPGIACLLLLRFESKSSLEFFGLSYAIGYCLNLLLYFLIVPFGLQNYSSYIVCAYAIMTSFYVINVLYKKSHTNNFGESTENKEWIYWIILSVALFVMQFMMYGLNNSLPVVGDRIYYMDQLYWEGNIVALSQNFPPMNIRSSGVIYGYHYFSSMQLSLVHLATNIRIGTLGMCYTYIQSNLLLVFSGFILFNRVLKNINRTAIAMGILFFTAGFEQYTYMNNIHHIIKSPFGFDYGISFGMFFVALVIIQWEKKKFSPTTFFLILLTFFACCGIKAPIACVVLCGLLVFCFWWVVFEKKWVMGLVYCIFCTLILVSMYLLLMKGYVQADSSDTGTSIGFLSTILRTPIYSVFNEFLIQSGINLSNRIVRLILVIPFVFLSQLGLYSLGFFGLLKRVSNLRKSDAVDLACIGMIFAGITAMLFISHIGLSQMYYLLASYPFLLLFGMKMLPEIDQSKRKKYKSAVKIICVVCITAGFVLFSYYSLSYIKSGMSQYLNKDESKIHNMEANYVSVKSYEAFDWVRKNTAIDSILVTNLTITSKVTSCTSVFTERQMWLEGTYYSTLSDNETKRRYEIIERGVNNDSKAIIQMANEGVNYILICNWLSPNSVKNDSFPIAFENDDYTIYKLN